MDTQKERLKLTNRARYAGERQGVVVVAEDEGVVAFPLYPISTVDQNPLSMRFDEEGTDGSLGG